LDLLDFFGMRATFFVLGTQAESHPDLVSKILRRGHGIGSHGYLHEHHLLRSPAWVRDDLSRSVAMIEAVAGYRPRWYRPSYGQLATSTVAEARRHDMQVVLWSAWGREWAERGPAPVVARIERRLEPGTIVLLHDNEVSCPSGTAARTHAVLGPLADKLDELGLRAVTLDDLLADDLLA
jgi:peptidoglycan/xylan/chitin deacetylase (PgdA/CDA1 family)